MANKYAQVLFNMLPEGRAWNFDLDSDNYKLLAGLSKIFEDLDEQIENIIFDMLPTTSKKQINLWLKLVDLTNAQIAAIEKLETKQLIASTLFINKCNFTLVDAQKLADKFGLKIKIIHPDLFNVSEEMAGEMLADAGWGYIIYAQVDDSKITKNIISAKAGQAVAGDRLVYKQNPVNHLVDILMLILNRKFQAHLTTTTNYYLKHA